MVLNRFTQLVPTPITQETLTAGIRRAIELAGVLPISEYTGARPSNGYPSNCTILVYPTEQANVTLILSIRQDLYIEQVLALGWNNETKKATSYTRDVVVERPSSTTALTIDALREANSLILSLNQSGGYSGLFGYTIPDKPDWWDGAKYPNVFQFVGRYSGELIGFDGNLNPYGVSSNYNLSEFYLANATPGGTRDVVPGPLLIAPGSIGSLAGKLSNNICRVMAGNSSPGDTIMKGSEEYLLITQSLTAGLAARVK